RKRPASAVPATRRPPERGRADRGQHVPAFTPDGLTRLANDPHEFTRHCLDEVERDRRGTLEFAPFLHLNTPTLHRDIVWARELGSAADARLGAHYPDRRVYRYSIAPGAATPTFTPLDSPPPRDIRDSTEAGAFDVAVIGAGATGSFAAERMARAGLRVALFEKDSRPGDSTVCAGGMNADVGRFIELPPSLVERVLPVLRLTADGRTTQWRFPTAPFLTVERRSLDALLAERATGAGVRLFTEARVTAVSPGESALHYESG